MAIAAGFRSANQHLVVPAPDDLAAAHGVGVVHDLHLVAHGSQRTAQADLLTVVVAAPPEAVYHRTQDSQFHCCSFLYFHARQNICISSTK